MSLDLILYLEIKNFNEYYIVYLGLDFGILVYVFVKVKNKVDFIIFVLFGFIIIDEMFFLYWGNVVVIKDFEYIYVGWIENMFIEVE